MNQTSAKEPGHQVPEKVMQALEGVVDPEIPVLTIRDLGILRDVRMEEGRPVVTITPTYSGCPAMVDIRQSIQQALADAGFEDARIETSLAPAWTTDWMSDEGKVKLRKYGIAPPGPADPGQAYSAFRDDGQAYSAFRDDGQAYSAFRDDGQAYSAFRDDGQAYSAFRDDGQGPNEHTSSRKRGGEADTLSGTHFPVPCPQCSSENTRLISAFGSTPCKALYQCNDCQEPFDHFKCH